MSAGVTIKKVHNQYDSNLDQKKRTFQKTALITSQIELQEITAPYFEATILVNLISRVLFYLNSVLAGFEAVL